MDKNAPTEVIAAIAWVIKSLSQNECIRGDAKRLQAILKIDREVLCRQQTRPRIYETSQIRFIRSDAT